ncbi:Homoserine O-acetyltransferase [bioreactor metagenome]|uniref:Homoserine O-acetyltransferase n=1 Tax=bioreactor metagenome TaxID=1076179 RepID=A0A645GLV7_9ZZZZ
MRGFDDAFYAPHSRHTTVEIEDILKVPELELLAVSDVAGAYLIASRDGRHVFATGHSEYDADTLSHEYLRDIGKGMSIALPANYYPNNDPTLPPRVTWRAHGNILFGNWLNYCVYQETPYDLMSIGKRS